MESSSTASGPLADTGNDAARPVQMKVSYIYQVSGVVALAVVGRRIAMGRRAVVIRERALVGIQGQAACRLAKRTRTSQSKVSVAVVAVGRVGTAGGSIVGVRERVAVGSQV